jgi:hypothetical protein
VEELDSGRWKLLAVEGWKLDIHVCLSDTMNCLKPKQQEMEWQDGIHTPGSFQARMQK